MKTTTPSVFFISLVAVQTLVLFASLPTEARPLFILDRGCSSSSSDILKTCFERKAKPPPPPPPPRHSPGPSPALRKSPPTPYMIIGASTTVPAATSQQYSSLLLPNHFVFEESHPNPSLATA